jgi:serine/threonine protein kinase/tetratricopeptide (TPR) repeat protein
MGDAWRRGAQPTAEEYLARHRAVADDPRAAVRLIYEEVCLRQEAGQELASTEVVRRYPRWRTELELLFGCHVLLEPRPAPRFPEAGEVLGDFRLLAELGRGALGRVFLAAQTSLADRPVVLKVTPGRGGEHLTLARLQHTHIIPLNGAQDFPERGLRALCMPYLGGTTLARLLAALGDRPPRRRTGDDLLGALDRAGDAAPVALPVQGPFRQFLARSSYAQAVCGIGACLADALDYAHARGLLHLDLSPSNILIAADGQPLLLDFHLARAPLAADGPTPEWIGGTPAYMSPEQEAALTAVRRGRPIAVAVDGRSDIYALGLILYEALGGTVPPGAGAQPDRLSRSQPHVSRGWPDILLRCLAADPRDRYPDAAALAADLRRHLADLPLLGVANRSPMERWRKLRRRQPHAPALAAMLLMVLAATLIVGVTAASHVARRHREARWPWTRAGCRCRAGGIATPRAPFCAAWPSPRACPGGPTCGGTSTATSAWPGAPPRPTNSRPRPTDCTPSPTASAICSAWTGSPRIRCGPSRRSVGSLWEARHQFLDRAGADLGPGPEQRLRADLIDLVVVGTDLRVRLAGAGDRDHARREALRTLGDAERALGPSWMLDLERRHYAEAPGPIEGDRAAAGLAPRTAWEHEALGRSLLRAGRLDAAAAALDRALELGPHEFWPNFYRGLCAYRLGHHADAEVFFRICAALAPASAECAYNLARVRQAQGRVEPAARGYDRALQLDPTLAPAFLNRGILHLQAGHLARAGDDLRQAMGCGGDPAIVHYNLALIESARGDRAAARTHLHAALRHDPQHPGARALCDRLGSPAQGP